MAHTRAFTSELPLSITMHGKLLPRDYSGRQYRAGGGGLIGRAQIAARDTAFVSPAAIVCIHLGRKSASDRCSSSAFGGFGSLRRLSDTISAHFGSVTRTVSARKEMVMQ